MFKEQSRRVRWLTQAVADALLRALPEHLADLVKFALHTGLRQRNVTQLEWSQIDMPRKVAWVHPDQTKTRNPTNQCHARHKQYYAGLSRHNYATAIALRMEARLSVRNRFRCRS